MVNDVILNTGEKLVRNKEATIKKILQSAKDEFTEHGFEQASVRIIAKNAGLHRVQYINISSLKKTFLRLL